MKVTVLIIAALLAVSTNAQEAVARPDPVESASAEHHNKTQSVDEKPMWETAKDIDGYYSYDGFPGILVRVSNQVELSGPGSFPEPPIYLNEKDKQNAFDLIGLIAKCTSDSHTFAKVLTEVKRQSDRYGEPLRVGVLRGSPDHEAFDSIPTGRLGLTGFYVDLDDLEIFPNPLRVPFHDSTEDFYEIAGHPRWAEFLCSALGHEFAEFAARRKNYLIAEANGRPFDLAADRINHHYRVANPISDDISKDYFESDRVRGEDCETQHIVDPSRTGDHMDRLIEIKPDRAIVIHYSAQTVQFSHELEERYGRIFNSHRGSKWDGMFHHGRKRWSYITYEEGFPFKERCSFNYGGASGPP